jgi:hypothetical protein
MQSTSTVAPVEHGLNGGAVFEDHAVGAHDPKPASHSASMVASADANANSSNTDDNDDDESGGSSEGTDPEIEALEREMERYVPRTKPSKPAVGAQPPTGNPPYAQGKAANTGTKSGRPPAVTATGTTTAPRPKK